MKLTREEGLATISLYRPEYGNRVNETMAGELREVAAQLSADSSVRVVILTGCGRVFSSGREAPSDLAQLARMQAARTVASLTMPVLVALNGDATDHGLELALAGDIRIATSEARFGFSHPSVAGFPYDGATQRLPRLVGPGWAQDLLLTGRMVDAGEALSMGLVNRVVSAGQDLLESARLMAGEIMEGSPIGARYAKEAVNSAADLSLGQGLVLETDLNVILQSTNDRAEGIASFLERRNPKFTGG